MVASENSAGAPERMVMLSRTFNAPRALVFQMWTRPELLQRWYAPKRCDLEIISFNFCVGGTFHHRIRDPNGNACRCSGVFEEIVPPERIVYTLFFCDEQGLFVAPESIGADPQWPSKTTVTVTLEEHEGKTTMTLHQSVPESIAKRTGAFPSWIEMLDRLTETLASHTERSR